MQRKSRILNRGGFALVAAVFLLILIASLSLQMLSSTSNSTQKNIDNYLNEQAVLLAYAATEQAILAISLTDPSAGCITTTAGTYPQNNAIFNITTNIRYIWANGQTAINSSPLPISCKNFIDDSNLPATPQLTLQTPTSGGSVMIDVVVTSTALLGLDQPIRFFKRTLQKL